MLLARATRPLARVTSRRASTSTLASMSARTPRARLSGADAVRVLWVCDVQEKFAGAVKSFDRVALGASTLVRGLPMVHDKNVFMVSEQVPDKLGPTVEQIKRAMVDANENESANVFTRVYAKTRFSMWKSDNEAFLPARDNEAFLRGCYDQEVKFQHVIVGLEAHVCVLQTVLDILRDRPSDDVFVCVDAVSSIRLEDRAVALRRMERAGAILTCTESVLFEVMEDATHPRFRDVSKLVREAARFASQLTSSPLPSI